MIKLDAKDMKILSLLDINARQSNNQIAKNTGLSKEVVHYRISSMIEKKIIVRFYTLINYFRIGLMKFKLYIRLTNADSKKIEDIANYFVKNKNTEWVAATTGRWDFVIGFILHNVNEFDDEILQFMNKYADYVQEKAVTTTLYLAHQTREFLKKDSQIAKVIYHTTKDKQESIDETDEKIIKMLTNNARYPLIEIAKKIKTTPRIVHYRIKNLEQKNLILGYKTNIDPKSLGRIFCKLIIYLNNKNQAQISKFISQVSMIEGAIWPQKVMGNWDLEIDFELANYEKFQEIIFSIKEKFPDMIKNHDFCILSKEYKLDFFPDAYPTFK